MKKWNEEKNDYVRMFSMFSLPGEAYIELRAILFSFSGDNNLHFRFYLEREPIEKDRIALDSYMDGIEAYILGTPVFGVKRIFSDCILYNEPMACLMDLGTFLYARKEDTGNLQFYNKKDISFHEVYTQKFWMPIGFAKAILGKIYKEIRMIIYHYEPGEPLFLYCIFEREPTDEDHANMQEIIDDFFNLISDDNRKKITSTKITSWFSEEGPLNRYYPLLGKPYGKVLYERVEYEFIPEFEFDDEE